MAAFIGFASKYMRQTTALRVIKFPAMPEMEEIFDKLKYGFDDASTVLQFVPSLAPVSEVYLSLHFLDFFGIVITKKCKEMLLILDFITYR